MTRKVAVFIFTLLAVAYSAHPSGAEQLNFTSAERLNALVSKICLSGGFTNDVSIASNGDNLNVSGSPGTVTIKKSEAQGLIGGVSPRMTPVQAAQASETRLCQERLFLSLIEKFRLWVGPTAPEKAIVRYVSGDKVETTILGPISAGRSIVICVQKRDPFADANEKLIVKLVRVFWRNGEVVSEEADFQPSKADCLSNNKPGYGLQAHVFDAAQYSILTRTTAGENGLIALFEHYAGKPQRRAANAVFGIPYNNMFTLEILVQ